jgi:hypothetical protein
MNQYAKQSLVDHKQFSLVGDGLSLVGDSPATGSYGDSVVLARARLGGHFSISTCIAKLKD